MTTNLPATYQAGGALANPSAGNPFLDAADDMGASSGALFMKFDGNTGIYSAGRDADEIPLGTRMAVNAYEFKNGWICWKDGAVMEEIMVRVVDGKPPARGTLADHGPYEDEKDGWREQGSVHFRDVETGDEFLYKAASAGGRIAAANLIRDYGKAFTVNPGKLAIVELDRNAFDAKDKKTGKKLGRKYAPVFKIVGWEDEALLIAKFAAADAAAEDAAEEEDVKVNPAGAAGARRRNFA